MRKFLVLIVFFLLTPTVICVCLALLFSSHHSVLGISIDVKQPPFAFAALPTADKVFEASATLSDKRPVVLQQFLSNYSSPLEPYAGLLVDKADQYGIDYRLLTAIAMQESTLCRKMPKNSAFNCWGWAIWGKHSRGFTSYQDAIDTISHYFANKKEKGVSSLDQIAKFYNPTNTNDWKQNVASFMAQL